MSEATSRQPIPVVRPDLSTSLIAFLDAALALSKAIEYFSPIGILPREDEYETMRLVCLLWASVNGLRRDDRDIEDEPRVMRFLIGHEHIISLHIPDGCDFDPLPKPAEAPRLEIDSNAMWSPASEVGR